MKQILILLLFLNLSAGAQIDNPGKRYLKQQIKQHWFEEPSWVEATKDLDYSPLGQPRETAERERKASDNKQNGLQERNENPSIQIERPMLTNIMKFIIILVAAVAIALLLKHFLGFGGIPWNKKIKAQQITAIKLETIEENLHDTDLNELIRQVIEQRQYAVAIRLYFLAILKELSLMQAIHWKKNKTNREYLQELQKGTNYTDFRQTARIFERIWYGNRAVNALDFQNLEAFFANFLQRLQQKNKDREGVR